MTLEGIFLMLSKQVLSPKYFEGPKLNNEIMLTIHLYVMT
jgi:hypothetical protein